MAIPPGADSAPSLRGDSRTRAEGGPSGGSGAAGVGPAAAPSRVAVLLATYNGAGYLDAQLESLATQTVPHVDVWASDDGSTDQTREILVGWAGRWQKGEFAILEGPRAGFARNFATLVGNAAIDADYFAFSDQDDIWDADKLARALALIENVPDVTARAYGSRTRLLSCEGERLLGLSPLFPHRPEFRNAIVQSIAGGNTIVINRAARELLARTIERAGTIVSHDWWTYLVVTGAGGRFYYDPEPSISYRQHGGNAIGSNDGWSARAQRLHRMVRGVFRDWNEMNVAALEANADLLSEEARGVLESFRQARTAPLPRRLAHLARSGIFRQTPLGQLGLYLACAMGRL